MFGSDPKNVVRTTTEAALLIQKVLDSAVTMIVGVSYTPNEVLTKFWGQFGIGVFQTRKCPKKVYFFRMGWERHEMGVLVRGEAIFLGPTPHSGQLYGT